MQVLIYEVAPGSCAVMIPAGTTGLYLTFEDAARAAWHTRHGTPNDQPEESPHA